MNKKNIFAIGILILISIMGFYITVANQPINKAKNQFNQRLKELRKVNRMIGEALINIDSTKQEDLLNLADEFSYYKLKLMAVVNLIEVNIDNRNKVRTPDELKIPQQFEYYKKQVDVADLFIKENKNKLETINKTISNFSRNTLRAQVLISDLLKSLFFVYKFK